MADVCANTIVAAIVNGFVEVSSIYRNVTLIVFYDDLSNKFIPTGASKTDIDLPNVTIIAQLA